MTRKPIISMDERVVVFTDCVEYVELSADADAWIVSVHLKSGIEITMGLSNPESEREIKDYFNYVIGCVTSEEVS